MVLSLEDLEKKGRPGLVRGRAQLFSSHFSYEPLCRLCSYASPTFSHRLSKSESAVSSAVSDDRLSI